MGHPRTDLMYDKLTEVIGYSTEELSTFEKIDDIIVIVLKNFMEIKAPEDPEEEQEETQYALELITVASLSGLGGGNSIKPGNILINWKKFFVEGLEQYLSVAGAIEHPYMIILAAIVIWSKVKGLQKIHIDQNHALVLTALWEKRNDINVVSTSGILSHVNDHIQLYANRMISKEEYDLIIEDLRRLETLEFNSDGTILLKESLCQSYS